VRGLIVGLIMFGMGWGLTEFLASSLQEYRTIPHRPDDGWVPEQVAKAGVSLADFEVRRRLRRPMQRIADSPPLVAEEGSQACGVRALTVGEAC